MAWVFDTHPADSRVVGPVKVAGTVVARYGTGGGNTPMVCEWGGNGGKDINSKSGRKPDAGQRAEFDSAEGKQQ